MTWLLRHATDSQEIPIGYMVDSVDGNSEETGLTIANTDILIFKAGATSFAQKNSGGGTHISNGVYYAVLDSTDTNTLGSGRIYVHVSGALAFWMDFVVLPQAVYDALVAGSASLETVLTSAYDAAKTAASQSSVNTIDDIIDAIKAKTDTNLDATISSRLPTTSYCEAPSVASIDAQLSGVHGAGAWGASAVGTIAYPYPLDPFLDSNGDPMVGVKIEAHSDSDRTALVDVQITDINGNFQFHLNAGDYWFRASLLQHVSYEWFVELGGDEE